MKIRESHCNLTLKVWADERPLENLMFEKGRPNMEGQIGAREEGQFLKPQTYRTDSRRLRNEGPQACSKNYSSFTNKWLGQWDARYQKGG